MKRTSTWWLAAMLSLALVLCCLPGGKAASASEWKWPRRLVIQVIAIGTGGQVSVAGIAAVMERQTGMSVKTVPLGAADVELFTNMALGAFEITQMEGGEWSEWLQGKLQYLATPKTDLRLVWPHNDSPWTFCVRGDSEIKTIYDIKKLVKQGKEIRVGVCEISPLLAVVSDKGLAAFLDIDPGLFKFVKTGSYVGYYKDLAEGKSDVAWFLPSSAVTYEIQANPYGLRWLGLPQEDKEGWARLNEWHPYLIPTKVEFGVKSAIGTEAGCSYWLLGAPPETDEELIYHFVKWLHENYDAYKDTHPMSGRMRIDIAERYFDSTYIPVHNGTIRYLKEIGKWTAADDAWNEECIKLVKRYCDAWGMARAKAAEKKIKIGLGVKEWEDLWATYAKDIPPFKLRK